MEPSNEKYRKRYKKLKQRIKDIVLVSINLKFLLLIWREYEIWNSKISSKIHIYKKIYEITN